MNLVKACSILSLFFVFLITYGQQISVCKLLSAGNLGTEDEELNVDRTFVIEEIEKQKVDNGGDGSINQTEIYAIIDKYLLNQSNAIRIGQERLETKLIKLT